VPRLSPIVRRVPLFVVAVAAGALLLVGVYAESWWSARWDGGWIEVSTGETRICIAGRSGGECSDASLDTLQAQEQASARRRTWPISEYERTNVQRISRARWLTRVVPLTGGLLVLAAAVAGARGRWSVIARSAGVALLLVSTATALLALGVFKATEILGDMPGVQIGAAFPLVVAGAALAAGVGAWVAAPMLASGRAATAIVPALAVAGALLLGAATVSTWCWSTQMRSSGQVQPIRSATLLRATYYVNETDWLGDNPADDPPDAVIAGRIAFVSAVATAACGVLLATIVRRRRSRPTRSQLAGRLAVIGVLGGAIVVLVSSAWFVLQVPKLSPVLTFLGWGPVLAVSGAILSGAVALWASWTLARTLLPQATATATAPPMSTLPDVQPFHHVAS